MVHHCNIHCRSIDADSARLLEQEDGGKWMPYMFLLEIVLACKLASDDEESFTYNCTTIFIEGGDSYIIDTPFVEFSKIFKEYYQASPSSDSSDCGSNDFEL
jgi:hypothetical protein